jgi:membrane protein DedA with SNARE-associated domain
MGNAASSSFRARAWLFWGALVVFLAAAAYALVWLVQHDAVLWLAALNAWLADNLIARFGYAGVFVMMFLESTFIPVPSEIVIPPAGDLARRTAEWSLGGVILVGTLGSLAGALFNYGLALYLGRPLLLRFIGRFGSWFHLSMTVYDRSEAFFLRHGAIATFTGRLIPGVRHLISLPAGLARMHLAAFCLLTALGATLWCAVLAVLGYRFGQDARLLSETLKEYSAWLAAGAVGLVLLYALRVRLRRPWKSDS